MHLLMVSTPTGSWLNTYRQALREEFMWDHSAAGLDAPDWIPTGGCYSWRGHVDQDTVFVQPHGENREYQ